MYRVHGVPRTSSSIHLFLDFQRTSVDFVFEDRKKYPTIRLMSISSPLFFFFFCLIWLIHQPALDLHCFSAPTVPVCICTYIEYRTVLHILRTRSFRLVHDSGNRFRDCTPSKRKRLEETSRGHSWDRVADGVGISSNPPIKSHLV